MIPKGFEILTASQNHDSMIKYREKGALRGVYLGFPNLNEFYTMALPGVTDWTGYPQSGKTELLIELLLNTSLFYGWKHLLYVPDIGSKEDMISLVIHKLTGKTFDKRYKSNYIEEIDISKNIDWVLEHFRILHKTDEKAKLTPYQFWDFGVEYSSTVIGGIQTMVIDSWKDMKHDRTMRDDQYLEDVLSYRNMIAEKYKVHLHTVIHPKGLGNEKTAKGERKVPGPDDLKGGSEWWNNGKNIIVVHRPEGSSNTTDIYIKKAKPKSVAKQGKAELFLDLVSYRYYHINENNNRDYASPILIESTASKMIEDDNDVPF
ncbi:hypothetical protein [Flavobacterium phage FCOV-F18]|uniref:SF4 helicase domain-containing protein n=1 Tax=Flavobacterium phage FCV-1.01 TaxID=2762666 RepID=A0A7G8AK92_9CAUD|nr:hypothetical protein [Flavobacterium phage V175]ASD51865.1 hypothetical protein [Flavobacterium phage V181]ASD52920.1 hypothetical protein [Flavobacterium phage V165]ASD52999.1 hypothetical protein [Flavobacterium phage V182]QCW20937.1 hypothetical protein [Flavobacterium phage FCOV-F2]QCW21013.1 hypothetical protein [Flavobacterium phage FCOV-F6]QCW21089.1 hypothetical protein [Flavobacterium phage FCOV-F9]QCW21313.1 hypothetical protein [Flavobacterium phage FCOV-F25]QCW21389.1 hypothe